MDRNTLIGFALIALVLIGFSYYNAPDEQSVKKQQTEQVASPKVEEKKTVASRPAADSTGLFGSALTGADENVVLENNKIRVVIATKGGMISEVRLKEYKSYQDYKAEKENPLLLYNAKDATAELTYETKTQNLNTADYYFTAVNRTKDAVTMLLSDADGKSLAYEYKLLPDNYLVNFSIRATGLANDFSPKVKTARLLWKDRVRQQEKGFYFENRYATLTYKVNNDNVEHLSEQNTEAEKAEGQVNWIAFKNQYFSSILMASQGIGEADLESVAEQEKSGYLKNFKAEGQVFFDPTGKESSQFQYYFGPNKYRLLQSMDKHKIAQNDQDLEDLVDLGWPLFRWINRYFTIYVFDFLTQFGLSMGIVLLLITLLLRVIVYAPTRKSYLSSARMRVLKPKVDEIAAKYPNSSDAMKKQQETMQMYSQYGVSPMGGCLPMLIQLPIWIAMFNFVPNAIELRQERFLWAEDLSTYDSIITWGTEIPYLGNHLSLFCILFVVSNILYTVMTMRQQRDSMSSEQAAQMKLMQWMMYLMPVFFFFMFNNYSSGLNYYYFISLLFSALTMFYLRKTTDDKKLLASLEKRYEANKNNPARQQSGLAARLAKLQEQAAEMQKRQEEMQKKHGKK